MEPITRERLYDMVWARPMLRIAEDLGVSSSYMARVCTVMNVPRPPTGYWAKKQVGRAPKPPVLPAAQPGDQLSWRPGEALNVPLPTSRRRKRIQRIETQENRPKTKLHPILGGVAAILKAADERDDFLRPTKRRMADILVTRATVKPALTFANRLFQAFEEAGCRVAFANSAHGHHRTDADDRYNNRGQRSWPTRWAPDRPTIVYVDKVTVALRIFEFTEELECEYINGNYVPLGKAPSRRSSPQIFGSWRSTHTFPTGRLKLQAYSARHDTTWKRDWEEKSAGELVDQVSKIVSAIKRAAPTIKAEWEAADVAEARRAAEWAEQQERWRRADEVRKYEELRKQRTEELYGLFRDWKDSRALDEYFRAIEVSAAQLPPEKQARVADKIDRARKLLSKSDPVQEFFAWTPPDSDGGI